MRRLLIHGCLIGSLWALPTATYEALQKSAEAFGARTGLQRLSCRAEEGVPWRPATGWSLFDHTAHELAEAHLFWRLAGHRLRGRLS